MELVNVNEIINENGGPWTKAIQSQPLNVLNHEYAMNSPPDFRRTCCQFSRSLVHRKRKTQDDTKALKSYILCYFSWILGQILN